MGLGQGTRGDYETLARLNVEITSSTPERRGPGRPRGAAGRVASVRLELPARQKRSMSPEGKARIAAAQKNRLAKVKRGAASNQQNSKAFAATARGNQRSKLPSGSSPARKSLTTPKKAGSPAVKKTSRRAGKRPANVAATSRPQRTRGNRTAVTRV